MRALLKQLVISVLMWEARLALLKYDPGVVAVTGNVGKTSAKDAIAAVLSRMATTRKSEKSFNSEIGLPLTILGLKNAWDNPWGWIGNIIAGLWVLVWHVEFPSWLVLEVGADHPGDIEKVSAWLKADIVVITAVGDIPVHVAYFESPEALAAEKAHLLKTLRPGGVAILNADDKRVMAMATPRYARLLTVGFNENADIIAVERGILYGKDKKPEGIACKIEHGGSLVPVILKGVLGYQHFYAVLMGCAVGLMRGGNIVSSVEALAYHETPRGRLRIIEGKKGSVILDDTYNASPKATEAGLATLKEIKTKGRKIAILGDMKELGSYENEAHEQVGAMAEEVCDVFVAVGNAMQRAASKAEDNGAKEVLRFKDSVSAADALHDFPKEHDIILIKGSQSMRMERIVEALMSHPGDKKTLLVRQEDEWKKR